MASPTAAPWICPACAAEGKADEPGDCSCCGAPMRVGSCGLLAEIGRGAGGVLFRGRDLRSGKAVSVRLLPEPGNLDGAVAAARRAGTLVHPHLAAVLDAGVWKQRPFAVLQELSGTGVLESDLTLREAVGAIRDAALGVEHALRGGLAHPALEPGCLLVVRKGGGRHVVVSGYEQIAVPRATPYAPPEERAGIPPDGRSNVWSLGAVLYALAAGSPPGHPLEPPSRGNPLVGAELEEILLKALDREPGRRHAGPGALADALTRWLGDDRPAPSPAKAAVPVAKPAWRRAWDELPERARVPVAAGAGVALLLVLVWMLWGGSAPAPVPDPPALADVPEPAKPMAEEKAPPKPPPPPDLPEPPKPEPAPPPPPPEPKPAPKPEPPKPAPEPPPSPPKPEPAPAKPEPLPTPKPEPAPRPKPEPPKPDPEPPPPPKPAPQPAPPPEPKPAPPPVPKPTPEPPAPKPVPPPDPKPAPPPDPKPVPPPPPAPPPAPASAGTVKLVHPDYGVFVRLESGSGIAVGDTLQVLDGDKVVAELKVEKLTKPDANYPNGAAVCKVVSGAPAEGGTARKGKG